MERAYPGILDQLSRGRPVRLESVSGGCIAKAQIATFADGGSVFVKCVAAATDMFEREAEGLEALAAANAIRVPSVLAADRTALVLERIGQGAAGPGFFESFGQKFARLHRHRGAACGFEHDNYIGSTRQVNRPLPDAPGDGSDWPGFFLDRRLRFQARLAAKNGHGETLLRLLDACEDRFNELLCDAIEPACILHGDLWGGNFIADEAGEPCLIDPAVYFGHREADLAMTRLFGGFGPAFYAAYEAEYPLAAGQEERLQMYQLYHLLNHLNLFGGGYCGQCKQFLQYYSK